MKVLLAKFCDYACQVDGGKASLIGMFNTIGGMQFPLAHPSFFICAEIEFEPHESGKATKITLRLIDEDGHELVSIEGQFTVPTQTSPKPVTIFQSFRVDHLTFPRPGYYRLDILSQNEPIGEARLYLELGPPPQVALG